MKLPFRFRAVAFLLGPYKRIVCGEPGCSTEVQYQNDDETAHWQAFMTEHQQQHQEQQ